MLPMHFFPRERFSDSECHMFWLILPFFSLPCLHHSRCGGGTNWGKETYGVNFPFALKAVPQLTFFAVFSHLKQSWNLRAIPRFCAEVRPKFLNFGYLVFIWWQSVKKTRNPEAHLEGLVYFGRTTNCMMINYRIRKFNIELSICNTWLCTTDFRKIGIG